MARELAHEEIWDDSALIDSWNQALAEYKKYHSIHARGGTVQATSDSSETHAKPETSGQDEASHDEADETVRNVQAADKNEQAETGTIATGESQAFMTASVDSGSGATGAGPQAVLGTIQDEGLKKLLMSWYYAGYYTGLYEGQQKGQTGQPGNQG